jgi:hypothetical protein
VGTKTSFSVAEAVWLGNSSGGFIVGVGDGEEITGRQLLINRVRIRIDINLSDFLFLFIHSPFHIKSND